MDTEHAGTRAVHHHGRRYGRHESRGFAYRIRHRGRDMGGALSVRQDTAALYRYLDSGEHLLVSRRDPV